MNNRSQSRIGAWALPLCCAASLHAATGEPTRPLETVVVTAHPLSAEGLALASEVLEGDALSRKLQSSIGATVGSEPGIHSSSFGQAVSRPVIHGLSGARVKVMEDRIDSLDVSVTSADHAITVEPFIAERIEILKGPSTLIYGSGAIGGVIDVHTGRIPHTAPDETISGRAELRQNNNGDQTTAAARLDGSLGQHGGFAWHLDAFTRDADPYEIPGFAESAPRRSQEAAQEQAGDPADRPVEGIVPGSQLNADGGALGLSWTSERGFIGAAVSLMDARYGLPGGHAEDHVDAGAEHAAEAPAPSMSSPLLDLQQTRIDAEAALNNPLPGFASVNARIGINRYEHREIEPSGETGTRFDNDAWEARLELVHEPLAGWAGALGAQYSYRDFSAVGEEAFIAPVETETMGLFWVGERGLSHFDLEAGVRIESVDVDPQDQPGDRFTGLAASVGLVVPFSNAWSLGVLLDYSRRAPVAEELYSYGPHLATRSFEIGNPNLQEESARNLSATLKYDGDRWFLAATAYYTRFSEFIYQAATGDMEEGLPVLAYRQARATFRGLDAEISAKLMRWERGELAARLFFDTVSAELDISGNDNLPRIPANRYGAGLDFTWGAVRANVNYIRVSDQNDVAEFELPTDGYDALRAYLGIDVPLGGSDLTLFVQGANLTDDEQRNHTSFLKDYVPLPGRTLEGGIQLRF